MKSRILILLFALFTMAMSVGCSWTTVPPGYAAILVINAGDNRGVHLIPSSPRPFSGEWQSRSGTVISP